MPQVKTTSPSKSQKTADPNEVIRRQPTTTSAHELISRMLEYEGAALQRGIDLTSGRFKMLTSAERDFHRSELIADYIRLSVGNLGNTPGYYEATLDSFCAKICDMEIPSHELIGTYLAAVEIVSQEKRLNSIPHFEDAVRRTMIAVLQGCVETLGKKASKTHGRKSA